MNAAPDNITPIRKSKLPTPVKSPRKRPAPKKPPVEIPTDIVSQVRVALDSRYRLATIIGILIGAFVPFGTFSIAHFEIGANYWQWLSLLPAGGLAYSATTVYGWGKQAFDSGFKAVGFTVLVEGIMTFSSLEWLSYIALFYLVVINGVATGAQLVLPKIMAKIKADAEAAL